MANGKAFDFDCDSNHFTGAVKSFSRWLVRESQLKSDPLIGLRKMNAAVDRRRVRRAFTDDELKRLLLTTQSSRKTYRGTHWQFTCTDRVMHYRTAANTGLRAKELASLTKDSFDFEAKTLTVEASNTKNRQRAVLPLSEAIIEPVKSFCQKLRTNELFPGRWIAQRMAGKMLARDLKRCGIVQVDSRGRCLDFHSLRYTFVSALARGKVHPAVAQRLARHSSIELTMSVYTDLNVDDLRGGVNALAFG